MGSAEPGRAEGNHRPGGADRAGRAGGVAARPDRPSPAARSAERARYRRRRAGAVLVVVAVVLAGLAAGAWWALGRFGPGVEEVRVTGVRQITDADVRSAAGVPDGTPLAAVDTAAVAARVSGIPGVADVEVSRGWPHTLEVAVVERTPVAIVDTTDGPRLVDDTGLAFRSLPEQPPRLPKLSLPRVAPDDPATRAALAAIVALAPPVRDQVDVVALGPSGNTLEFTLTEGRRVLWGRWAGVDAVATARRAGVLGPLLTREGTVYDVSSPELPTVRR